MVFFFNKKKEEIIIGIDAGTTRIGYSILSVYKKKSKNFSISLISFGLLDITEVEHHLRLKQIYKEFNKLLKKYKPNKVIVERLYFNLNAKTAMEVSQAIGVIILASVLNNVFIDYITPTQVKSIITTNGKATKQEIAQKVKSFFDIQDKLIDDITDAIAIALAFVIKEYSNNSNNNS
jgi:crossover junction endodeoxyribonuclease RuvC